MSHVRPVMRRPAKSISQNWDVRVWKFSEGFGCEVNLLADWYAVSLSSSPNLAEEHLCQWTAATPGPKWLLSDLLLPIEVSRQEVASSAPKGSIWKWAAPLRRFFSRTS